jgi:hypothetical protein
MIWMSQDFIDHTPSKRFRTLMRTLGILKRLAEQKAAGPTPSFTEVHIAKAIEIIGRKPIGRLGLSERLGLGEGTTRTLIDRLLEARLAKVSKRGCELTESGSLILKDLSSKLGPMTRVTRSPITIGPHNFGILVRKAANKVNSGIEQRDAAVRAGANGAVTFVFKGRRLLIPPVHERITEARDVIGRILEDFRPREKDVIVIAGAGSEKLAEDGARAAAWTLLN